MFRVFRRLVAALESTENELRGLVVAVLALCTSYDEQGPAVHRLDALELNQRKFHAECEGLLLSAEGKLRAANNAEARERANKRSYQHVIDAFDEDGDPPESRARNPDSGNDVATGEAEGVHPLHLDVAPTDQEIAKRAKFGLR